MDGRWNHDTGLPLIRTQQSRAWGLVFLRTADQQWQVIQGCWWRVISLLLEGMPTALCPSQGGRNNLRKPPGGAAVASSWRPSILHELHNLNSKA